jgi:hypothetical protein
MIRRIHPVAGATALAIIATFWTSTALTELWGDVSAIAFVKRAILWGLLALVPAMALAGATGAKLAARRTGPVVAQKKRRMPIIAMNGVFGLISCAFYLDNLASRGEFGSHFWVAQALELTVGAINITLLSLNFRDGRLRWQKNGADSAIHVK